jgi:hypothetical protein
MGGPRGALAPHPHTTKDAIACKGTRGGKRKNKKNKRKKNWR